MNFDQIPISALMTRDVITLPPDDRIIDHARVFESNRIHHAPVVDRRGEILGMVSSRDIENYHNITRIVNSSGEDPVTIRDIMTSPIFSYLENVSIQAAAEAMLDNHLHAVVVVDKDEKMVGIVTSTDLLRFIAQGGVVR